MIVIEGLNYFGIMVSNIDASVNFYRDTFDFEFLDRISGSEQAFMKMGDIMISLIKKNSISSGASRLAFSVDANDFDDIIDEVEEGNYQLIGEVDEDTMTVVIADPDGNEIEISARRIG